MFKDAERKLPVEFVSLGKMLLKELREQLFKEFEKEVTQRCLEKNPFCLRLTDKHNMQCVTLESVKN